MYAPIDRNLLPVDVPPPAMRIIRWVLSLGLIIVLIVAAITVRRWHENQQPTTFDLERTEIVRNYWRTDAGLQLWSTTISDVTVRDRRIIVHTSLAPDEYDFGMAIYETFWRYVLTTPSLEVSKVVILDHDGHFLTGSSA